jgi:hypothetical protein
VSAVQIVIEQSDFRRLSTETQREVMQLLAGRTFPEAQAAGKKPAAQGLRWRRPVDLTPELARMLVHGLSEDHRRRLRAFANRDGRVKMSELLAVSDDRDMRVLSYFEGVVTRKLRRLLEDSEKKATLLGWDYDSTVWDGDNATILDGVYYVTDATAAALRDYFGVSPDRSGPR